MSPCGAELLGRDDPESEPALNGLNDTEGRLAIAIFSSARDDGL